jgi:hypothetical protein
VLKFSFAGLVILGVAACANSPKGSRYALEYQPTVDQRELPAGTQIVATLRGEVSSAIHSPGEIVEAVVKYNIRGPGGVVTIPAGSTVFIGIASLEPAREDGDRDGRLSFTGHGLSVGGISYSIAATAGTVDHSLVGHAVTMAAATESGPSENIAAPAPSGQREVVVAAGTRVVLTLTQPLSVWVK